AELELEPPIDLDLLASAQGIGRIEQIDLPWSGCLLVDGAGMVMRIRESDHPRRQRFTGCHEISHTLLPGFTTATAAYRCTPGDGQPDQASDRNVELLADVAASEFLLPRRHVTADLLDAPFGWDTISEVADAYEASLEATARRYVALAPGPAILITLKPATSKANSRPTLRVANRTFTGDWPYIPINKSVPDDHPLGMAAREVAVDEVTDLCCLTGTPSPVTLSARLCPYYDNQGRQIMRVLALATPAPTAPSRSRRRG
ncbi:MAG: ImmA/IrrE family metallo-endopeptidase, partial [Mycobacteriales bacterium]